ncbi:MAG: hypothetical protein EOO69_03655 [Moraxellaceae bacterium]|nr:MAG: hypothetical protein EOO69_03655 [Moraxellaceae bacterium]
MKFHQIIIAVVTVFIFQTAYSQDVSADLSEANLKEYQQQIQIAYITAFRPEARKNFKDNESLRQRKLAMQKEILNFRNKIALGAKFCTDYGCDISGIVLEKKGDLIKGQIEEKVCTMKNYNSACIEQQNLTTEKWLNIDELVPTICVLNAACFPLVE